MDRSDRSRTGGDDSAGNEPPPFVPRVKVAKTYGKRGRLFVDQLTGHGKPQGMATGRALNSIKEGSSKNSAAPSPSKDRRPSQRHAAALARDSKLKVSQDPTSLPPSHAIDQNRFFSLRRSSDILVDKSNLLKHNSRPLQEPVTSVKPATGPAFLLSHPISHPAPFSPPQPPSAPKPGDCENQSTISLALSGLRPGAFWSPAGRISSHLVNQLGNITPPIASRVDAPDMQALKAFQAGGVTEKSGDDGSADMVLDSDFQGGPVERGQSLGGDETPRRQNGSLALVAVEKQPTPFPLPEAVRRPDPAWAPDLSGLSNISKIPLDDSYMSTVNSSIEPVLLLQPLKPAKVVENDSENTSNPAIPVATKAPAPHESTRFFPAGLDDVTSSSVPSEIEFNTGSLGGSQESTQEKEEQASEDFGSGKGDTNLFSEVSSDAFDDSVPTPPNKEDHHSPLQAPASAHEGPAFSDHGFLGSLGASGSFVRTSTRQDSLHDRVPPRCLAGTSPAKLDSGTEAAALIARPSALEKAPDPDSSSLPLTASMAPPTPPAPAAEPSSTTSILKTPSTSRVVKSLPKRVSFAPPHDDGLDPDIATRATSRANLGTGDPINQEYSEDSLAVAIREWEEEESHPQKRREITRRSPPRLSASTQDQNVHRQPSSSRQRKGCGKKSKMVAPPVENEQEYSSDPLDLLRSP